MCVCGMLNFNGTDEWMLSERDGNGN